MEIEFELKWKDVFSQNSGRFEYNILCKISDQNIVTIKT